MRKVSIIVAISNNWVIGKKNNLPWRLPADLKHFKEITTGHTVIMGRRTYESIGKPLPNRLNIVLTGKKIDIPGCKIARSLSEALDMSPDDHEIFIIGGSEIYSQFLPLTDKIYLTRIYNDFDGDIFFPRIEFSEWKEISRQDHKADEKNPYNYSFLTYEK